MLVNHKKGGFLIILTAFLSFSSNDEATSDQNLGISQDRPAEVNHSQHPMKVNNINSDQHLNMLSGNLSNSEQTVSVKLPNDTSHVSPGRYSMYVEYLFFSIYYLLFFCEKLPTVSFMVSYRLRDEILQAEMRRKTFLVFSCPALC